MRLNCLGWNAFLAGALLVLAAAPAYPQTVDRRDLSPIRSTGPMEIAALTVPVSNVPASGEIQIRGHVQDVEPSQDRLCLLVTDFMLPNGHAERLHTPAVKTVLFTSATQILDGGGHAMAVEALHIGAAVAAIGTDNGTGRPLPARCIATGVSLESFSGADDSGSGDVAAPAERLPLPARPLPPDFVIRGSLMVAQGRMSTFGGPDDLGVGADEGLALVGYQVPPELVACFLAEQPPGTTGLARRLNPEALYIACRWDYSRTPRSFLSRIKITVTNTLTGQKLQAQPVDWGPGCNTNRVADLSPGLARRLRLGTNGVCRVEIPMP